MTAARLLRTALMVMWPAVSLYPAQALTLYFTDFEEFSAGSDQWAGAHGWAGNSVGVGAHGIDQDILPGLGKTAYIGFNQPAAKFITVFRPEFYDPLSNGMRNVEFETLMGIEDSTNAERDSFFFTFYNSTGGLLGAVQFNNTESNFGIWRLDGTNQFDTGVEFIRGELHLLFADLDFSNNTWSADLDGIPLFTGAQFNATGQSLDLGFMAAEWQLTASTTNDFGNNWMLVADWAFRALPVPDTPYVVEGLGAGGGTTPGFSWTGQVGFDYAVEHSDNLLSWTDGLPGSVFTNILTNAPLTFIDKSNADNRSYRIRRTLAP